MIIKKRKKGEISNQQFVLYYVLFTLFINLIIFIVLSLFFSTKNIYSPDAYSSKFAVKYILLSSFLAVILAYSIHTVLEYIRYNFILRLWHHKIDKSIIKRLKVKFVIKDTIAFLILFLISFLFFGVKWALSTFSFLSIDELVFHLMVPLEGAGREIIYSFLKEVLIPSLLTAVLYFVLTGIYYFYGIFKIEIKVNRGRKSISLLPLMFLRKFIFPVTIVLLIFTFAHIIYRFGFKKIYDFFFLHSSFVEKNYSDAKNVKLTFPEEKRNLIFLFMESMEVTSLSKELGGFSEANLIPELWEIADRNINFSESEKVGGARQIHGTGWTIGAMVAQSAGLPLILSIGGNSYTGNSFLPGMTSLGDILYQNGYNQTLIVGSNAKFAGRDQYYKTHGNQRILDIFTAYEDRIIPPGYNVWWGFEDRYLYEYAKKELSRLSREKQPFSLTLLTVDTHHIGGYVCPLCRNEYPEQMSNVIACASRQAADFIGWLENQDYYDDTTIIISGDHLSMDAQYYKYVDPNYIRKTINIFINSVPLQTRKDRLFSTLDIFPTTLASMGVEIEGNRLGLGTNLFSEEKTILEIYGIDHVMDELNKRSKFYNSFFR